MKQEQETLFIKRSIKKINRKYSSNIFSEKLNKNLIFTIMDFLNLKSICNFNKTSLFIYNNFIDYENIKISEKFTNNTKTAPLLKINLKNKKEGFCFLCSIPYEYCFYNLTTSIIINNNFINDFEDNKLKIFYNNKNEEIDIKDNFKFIDKDYNITIIDIGKNNYEFNNCFELKENIFEYKKDNKENSIYILYYSNDNKINISFGELKDTEDKNIFIFLNTKNNFPFGSPIFNSITNNLIGYYKGYNNKKNYNEGQYFRYPLNNFIYENYIRKNNYNFCLKNIFKKIKEFVNTPSENYTLISFDEDSDESEYYYNWKFIIEVTDECPYKGGKFLFIFHYSKDIYKSPQITLINKIYHPNFKGDHNKILYNCNEGRIINPHWHPRLLKDIMIINFFVPINETLNLIYSLITHPSLEPGDVLNNECAKEMENHYFLYEKKAKQWTEEYASEDIYDEYLNIII